MNPLRQRCEELLADRATGDLDTTKREELDHILTLHPEWDDDSYELMLAQLDVAWSGGAALPESLRQRLIQAGAAWRRT